MSGCQRLLLCDLTRLALSPWKPEDLGNLDRNLLGD